MQQTGLFFFSVLISVVADSHKGEAVTNQNYNKICDILSFIKYKTQDIQAENLRSR